MDSAQKMFALFLLLAAGVGLYAIHNSFRENRLYIERGYTQKTFPGRSEPVWVKE